MRKSNSSTHNNNNDDDDFYKRNGHTAYTTESNALDDGMELENKAHTHTIHILSCACADGSMKAREICSNIGFIEFS